EWVHVQLHQQKGMISLSPPTICNSAKNGNGILQYDSLSGLRFASKSGKGGRMRLLNGGFTKQK
ncbi:hypothetical protein, partial [Salmonella enterica]|uniref:hypothetical protein n=1 Tax=Salmonella enterica TaxID=28901 RepID=UPI001C9B17C7